MNILQLLFPLRCPVCDDIVRPYGAKICVPCREKLKLLTPPWCMQCGKKLYTDGYLCQDCQRKKHKYLRGRALYEYESAAPAIYRFKYGKRQEYADFFGEEIARFLGNFIRQCNPDGLIPVSLHAKRMRHRGYNQAQLIAEALSEHTGIPVNGVLIGRCKRTKPLKNLTGRERQNNLKKAFKILQNDVKLDTIVIIDDVYTTGSTADAMTQVLQSAGISKVYVLTLTIGRGI